MLAAKLRIRVLVIPAFFCEPLNFWCTLLNAQRVLVFGDGAKHGRSGYQRYLPDSLESNLFVKEEVVVGVDSFVISDNCDMLTTHHADGLFHSDAEGRGILSCLDLTLAYIGSSTLAFFAI